MPKTVNEAICPPVSMSQARRPTAYSKAAGNKLKGMLIGVNPYCRGGKEMRNIAIAPNNTDSVNSIVRLIFATLQTYFGASKASAAGTCSLIPFTDFSISSNRCCVLLSKVAVWL